MSGVRRFLSRRDKSPAVRHGPRQEREASQHLQSEPSKPKQPEHFAGVFVERTETHAPHGHAERRADKEHEKKAKAVLERLRYYGIDTIVEANVEYALQHVTPQDDEEAAFKLLLLLQDTYEGIVKPYDPNMKLAGAVNKQGVTCYLDALLFSMFVRLDSFEAMLYDNFPDPKRKRLAALLRLWVNLLRSGRLIRTDVTAHIQHALADCGWSDANMEMQQDPSEAFTFITGQLELPMLTLKMDMFHTGKEDPQDDHKFVNERLLEVAVLDAPAEGRSVITLEDCLEHYFNNRIEVKRHMENQRRNTLKSGQLPTLDNPRAAEKESGTHVEVLEMPETPITASPSASTPLANASRDPVDLLRPTLGRKRQDSIFSQRKVELIGIDPETLAKTESNTSQLELPARKMSTRTEVLMPAWQFFKLLPWYTDSMPTSDAGVAAHFARKRPVLGICLKRYGYTNEGQAKKREDYVDIPLEIAVPNFVSGDEMDESSEYGEQVGGNFRLMLQAVVCHRGVSVNSGHYICLTRSLAARPYSRRSSDESEEVEDPWMRLDDLARERVTEVNIHEALKKETPYLLFYQVQPIDEDGSSIHDLPSYTEATSRSQSDALLCEKPYVHEQAQGDSTSTRPIDLSGDSTDTADWAPVSERGSLDVQSTLEMQRGRTGIFTSDPSDPDSSRKSITLDTSSISGGSVKTDPTSSSVAATPTEEKSGNGFLTVASKMTGSRRGSKVSTTPTSTDSKRPSRSRGTSTEGTKRLSLNMAKLTQRMSKTPSTSELASVADFPASEKVEAELARQPKADDDKGPVVSARAVHGPRDAVASGKQKPPLVVPKGKKERRKLKGQAGVKGDEDRECALM